MKKLILFLFMANILFAIEQVPRQRSSDDESETKTSSEVRASDSRTTTRDLRRDTKVTNVKEDKQPDRFQDTNSNGVNDRREDDFQNIKTKKSKYKELFGKKEDKAEKQQRESQPREDKEVERTREK